MINDGPPFVVRVKDDYLIRRDTISHIILRDEMIEVEVIKAREALLQTFNQSEAFWASGWREKEKRQTRVTLKVWGGVWIRGMANDYLTNLHETK